MKFTIQKHRLTKRLRPIYICIMRIPEKKKERKQEKKIFEITMPENFP